MTDSSKPLRILVVDDEPQVGQVIARLPMSNALFAPDVFLDSNEALQAARSGDYEVVVSDIVMPGMDGLELMRKIRSFDFHLPIILLTGTPARQIEGTWATSFPVPFFIKTDYCSSNPELVASEKRMVTTIVTAKSEYTVDVEMRHESSDYTVLDAQCDPSGYVPDVSPMFLSGFMSATELTIKNSEGRVLGIFEYTTDLKEGSWSDLWCALYCQNVYTEPNQLKLTRQ